MANSVFQIKRTSVSGRAANSTTLTRPGELALNMADGILYSTNGTSIFEVGANNTNSRITGNATIKAIIANGSIGSAGQTLTTNGVDGIYWSSSGSGTVTNVATGNGLTGGPITATGTISILANTGIVANTTGTFVNAAYIATIAANTATYANQSVTNTFTIGTATYAVTNGNFGIGTSLPSTRLTVNPKVIDDNALTYDSNTVYITHQAVANATVLNDPKPVLLLARQGQGGLAYGSGAEFALSRYENNGVNSRTRLDLRLAHTTFMTSNITVATFLSNGNIGIGNTAPAYKLRVEGDVSLFGGVHANGSLGTAGQVLHSNGTSVYWAADDNSGGTVTSIVGGTGITGGTITTSGTFSVNSAYIATISANNATYLNGLASTSYARSDASDINQILSFRVIRNTTATGNFSDGMYIGYAGANSSATTKIYSQGSSTGHYYSDASGNIFRSDGVAYVKNDGGSYNLTANNSTFINGNNVVSVMESLRANRSISGGGTITVDGSSNVLWSSRFIVISNGRGTHFSSGGYFDITCPTTGTITGVGGATNKTATAAGIPLGNWEAIYYILPIGSGSGSVAANFRVVSYTSDLEIPSDWVLICLKNGDNANFIFNNGITLEAGQSFDTTLWSSAIVPTANSSVYANQSITNTFTVGTSTYFVSNGFVGVGTSTPSDKFQVYGTASTDFSARVDSATAGDRPSFRFIHTGGNLTTQSPSAARLGLVSFAGVSDASSFTTYSFFDSFLEGTANSTANSYVKFHAMTGGTLNEVMRINGNRVTINSGIGLQANGSLGSAGEVLHTNGSSVYWAADDAGAFPSGTVMLFGQTAAPTGWTKLTTHDNKALRVVSGTAGSGGTVAFTTAFASQAVSGSLSTTAVSGTTDSTTAGGSISSTTATGTVGSTTLDATTIPSHTHFVAAAQAGAQALTNTNWLNRTYDGTTNLDYALRGGTTVATLGLSSATGSSGSHTHTFTGTSHGHTFTGTGHTHTFSTAAHGHTFTGTAINMAVQYVDVILASKD